MKNMWEWREGMNERVDSIDEEARENVKKRIWEFGYLV
jgi:hypothetical protein